MATSILTVLAVVVESLQGCDWLTLWHCEPIPLLVCICRLVNAARWNDDSSSYVVRHLAVLVLGKLIQLLGKHSDSVPCKSYICI